MRRLALLVALLGLFAACKRVAGNGDAAASDASDTPVDAGQASHGSTTFTGSGPPRVPVIDFTPDASASPDERKRALASLLAGASPAGNLEEEATDPDAGFEYRQYTHLTQQEVELAPAAQGEAQVGAATVTAPIPNVDRVLAGLRPRLRMCYRRGLASEPEMKGKLTLRAKVLLSVEVALTEVSQNVGLSPSVASCASRALGNVTFDALAGGSDSTLTVPVTFVPKP